MEWGDRLRAGPDVVRRSVWISWRVTFRAKSRMTLDFLGFPSILSSNRDFSIGYTDKSVEIFVALFLSSRRSAHGLDAQGRIAHGQAYLFLLSVKNFVASMPTLLQLSARLCVSE